MNGVKLLSDKDGGGSNAVGPGSGGHNTPTDKYAADK